MSRYDGISVWRALPNASIVRPMKVSIANATTSRGVASLMTLCPTRTDTLHQGFAGEEQEQKRQGDEPRYGCKDEDDVSPEMVEPVAVSVRKPFLFLHVVLLLGLILALPAEAAPEFVASASAQNA